MNQADFLEVLEDFLAKYTDIWETSEDWAEKNTAWEVILDFKELISDVLND